MTTKKRVIGKKTPVKRKLAAKKVALPETIAAPKPVLDKSKDYQTHCGGGVVCEQDGNLFTTTGKFIKEA